MERIRHAIEKDKQKDSARIRNLSAKSNSNDLGKFDHISTDNSQELENVIYTQTRVVKLQEKHLESHRIVSFNKNNPLSINFDLLRTHILQKMEENGWRTLAITSPTPESGKTVVAINLAMSIAHQTNKTAMLVDFDLRRPKIGSYLGLQMEKSLNDLIEGTSELEDVLINPDIPRLVVLATNNPVKKSSETLSSKKISDLIQDLRERYASRIVIFDLPPVLVSDDVIALLPKIDCVLMVVANGMSTKREIEDCLRLLPAENLLGTVLNKAEMAPAAYYY